MSEIRKRLQGTPIKDAEGAIVRWRVRVGYTTTTGAKKVKGFERKLLKDAQDAAIEWLAQHGRVEHHRSSGTVKEAIDAVDRDLWSQLRGGNTRADYKRCADAFAKEFGGRQVDDISAPQLTNYFKRFSDQSPRMMAEHWKVVRAIFGYAASDLGWIDTNPMDVARKPKATGRGREWLPLTRSQFNEVLSHLDPTCRLFYRLLGETGARPSEAWTLNTETRLVFQCDVWWFVVEMGKTEASTRRIPIPDSLYRDLVAAGPLPFREIMAAKSPATYVRWRWMQALESAGIPYTRPYEVRAMRINEWRRAKVDSLVRRSMAGHTSEKTTNDWYDLVDPAEVLKALHISPGGRDDAGEK